MIKKKVKYKGIKYKVSIKGYFIIKFINIRLKIRRALRWLNLFHATDLIIIVIMLITWGIICYVIGKTYPEYLYSEWPSLLMNVTASTIIVGFIAAITRIGQYKRINKEQYWLYQGIVSALNALFGSYYGKMIHHYEPFYCEETIKQTFCLVKNNEVTIEKNEIIFYVDTMQKRIDELSNHLMSHSFNNCNIMDVRSNIYKCEKYLLALKTDKIERYRSYFEDLIFWSNQLLNEIGKTWKRDDDINKKICRILMNNGYDLLDNFYLRMKFYSVWEIKEYLLKNNLLLYEEEDRLVYLYTMERGFPGENECIEKYGFKDYDNKQRRERLVDKF